MFFLHLVLALSTRACMLHGDRWDERTCSFVEKVGKERETQPSTAYVFRPTRSFAELGSQLLALGEINFRPLPPTIGRVDRSRKLLTLPGQRIPFCDFLVGPE
jgi:hypothetical protein